ARSRREGDGRRSRQIPAALAARGSVRVGDHPSVGLHAVRPRRALRPPADPARRVRRNAGAGEALGLGSVSAGSELRALEFHHVAELSILARAALLQLLVGIDAPQAFLRDPAVEALARDTAPAAGAALDRAEHAHLQPGNDGTH